MILYVASVTNINDHLNTGAPLIFDINDVEKDRCIGQISVSYDDMDDDCTPHYESSVAPDVHNAFIVAYERQCDIEDGRDFTFEA